MRARGRYGPRRIAGIRLGSLQDEVLAQAEPRYANITGRTGP